MIESSLRETRLKEQRFKGHTGLVVNANITGTRAVLNKPRSDSESTISITKKYTNFRSKSGKGFCEPGHTAPSICLVNFLIINFINLYVIFKVRYTGEH